MAVEEHDPLTEVRAIRLLGVRGVWLAPIVLIVVLIFLMTLTYFGSVVNPAGHLSGLPVLVVNQDTGTTLDGHRVDIGEEVAHSLLHTKALTDRLALTSTSLATAKSKMDVGDDYATIEIPSTFSRSLAVTAGLEPSSSGVPATSTITLLTNPRLGSIGVSLATAVVQSAIKDVSSQVADKIEPLSTSASRSNPVNSMALADPVALSVVEYRPIPADSALGLSAFYVSLLALMCGFLGATIVNSSVDAAVGYAPTEVGAKWSLRQPVSISRWQTLLTKWGVAVVIVPLAVAVMLLVASGVLGLDAPHPFLLWLFASFAAIMIAFATLVLFAALGMPGQLIALVLFVYLALASSGGTVPLQAVPGPFRFVSQFEPLRQVLVGARSILYFDAQGAAGLTRSTVVIGVELAVAVVLGVVCTVFYDRRKLHRISPEILVYVDEAVRSYHGSGDDGTAVTTR